MMSEPTSYRRVGRNVAGCGVCAPRSRWALAHAERHIRILYIRISGFTKIKAQKGRGLDKTTKMWYYILSEEGRGIL